MSQNLVRFSVIVILLLVGLFVYPLRAQEASRMALTASLFHEGSVEINDYPLGVDKAERDGKIYSDKAPGQPFLAVPVYALAQAMGLEPAYERKIDSNLTLWLVTFGTVTIPAIILYLVGRRLASNAGGPSGELAAAAVATGTLLLPFSTILFGHILAGLCVGLSYLVLREAGRASMFLWSGLIAGLGVLVEYQVALGVAILGVWALAKRRLRGGLWFVGGGLLPAGMLAAYNTAAFGSMFAFSYDFSTFPSEIAQISPAVAPFGWKPLDNLVLVLFSARGFAVASPIVLLALMGSVGLIRKRGERDAALAASGIFLALLAVPLLWQNPWGGRSPGPRYLVPALVLLVPGLAHAWRRRPQLTVFAWLVSFVSMLTATATDALALPRSSPSGVDVWVVEAIQGRFMTTLPEILWGEWGRVGTLVLLGVFSCLLVYGMFRSSTRVPSTVGGSLVASSRRRD